MSGSARLCSLLHIYDFNIHPYHTMAFSFVIMLDWDSLSWVLLDSIFIELKWLYFCRLTCIYAACKIEENHVSAEELGKGIAQDHQMILNNEMIVLQAWICLLWYCLLYLPCAFIFFHIFASYIAESRFWSYCFCTISFSWRFCWWHGG